MQIFRHPIFNAVIILAILIVAVNLVALLPSGETMSSNRSQEIANTASLTVNMAPVDGDCFIVQLPNQKIMLIDAGEGESRQIVFNQLDSLGIKHIDYLVGTHQHSDHMWNLFLQNLLSS
jgi:beta-lactamase superfamily II metal-dependent hydrolase